MTPTNDLRGFRRVAPAFGLFFLAPLVAEFLLGNMAIDTLGALVVLAPLYGGGSLLIREVARRAGRGWGTMLLLALAYALVEEGLVIQTLFNPSYFGLHLLEEAHVPGLGMGGWWTLFVLTLHVVWSISVPIALVEACVPDRAERPWLGKPGLGVTAGLGAIGALLIYLGTHRKEGFTASAAQLGGTAAVVVLVVVAAFRLRPSPREDSRPPPHPFGVGAFAFGVSAAFMAAHSVVKGWAVVATYLGLYAVTLVVVGQWSRRAGWTPLHRLAVAGGGLLTYAVNGFVQTPILGSKGTIALVGNAVFAAGAVVLLVGAVRAVRRAGRTA